VKEWAARERKGKKGRLLTGGEKKKTRPLLSLCNKKRIPITRGEGKRQSEVLIRKKGKKKEEEGVSLLERH